MEEKIAAAFFERARADCLLWVLSRARCLLIGFLRFVLPCLEMITVAPQ